MQVRVSSILPSSPEKVFAELQKFDALRKVASPILCFESIDKASPKKWTSSRKYRFKLYFFNCIYLGIHTIKVRSVNPRKKEISTHESSLLAKVWNHTILLKKGSLPDTSEYTDIGEIHSGLLTPFVWLFAEIFYRHRQKKWKEIAKSL